MAASFSGEGRIARIAFAALLGAASAEGDAAVPARAQRTDRTRAMTRCLLRLGPCIYFPFCRQRVRRTEMRPNCVASRKRQTVETLIREVQRGVNRLRLSLYSRLSSRFPWKIFSQPGHLWCSAAI